jgi:hypothetical protein
LQIIRKQGRELMRQWGVERQWKKRLADEVHEWVLLPSAKLWVLAAT